LADLDSACRFVIRKVLKDGYLTEFEGPGAAGKYAVQICVNHVSAGVRRVVKKALI
jgi:hypothetical protein